jgi:hypothetical protein
LELLTGRIKEPDAVLAAVLPLPFIGLPVRPRELAMSVFLIVTVVTYVGALIRPRENALAVHFVESPLTLELSRITPDIRALPVEEILTESAVVFASVAPVESTVATF